MVYLREDFCPTCGRHQRKDRIRFTFMAGFSGAAGYWAYRAGGGFVVIVTALVAGGVFGWWIGGRVAPKPTPDAPSARSALDEYHRKAALLEAAGSSSEKPLERAPAATSDSGPVPDVPSDSPEGSKTDRAVSGAQAP